MVSRTDGDPPPVSILSPPLPRVSVSKNLRVQIQSVPVCTGTTPACGNTCARGAGTHGDVLNLHTEVFSACQAAPHTTPHTQHTTQHNTQHYTHTTQHHNTQHHTETESERHRDRETRQDKKREDEDEKGETRR